MAGIAGQVRNSMQEKHKNIAILLYAESSWGALDSKGTKATEKEVIAFFDTALAVCYAESRYNTKAVNGTAVGLFQIKTDVHRELIGSRDMTNPRDNIAVAASLSRASHAAGKGMWNPWTVHKTGAHKPYLGHGKHAYEWIKGMSADQRAKALKTAEETVSKGDEGIVPDGLISSPLSVFGDGVDKVLGFVKETGAVIGLFILALLLIGLGIAFLIGKDKAAKAVSLAGNAIPAGRAINLVKGISE